MNRGEVIGPLADESLLVPIALRHADPSLFAGDAWLAKTSGIFSVPYSWIVAKLLAWIDDPVVALRLLSMPAHAALLAGTWRLVERFAGRTPAALATLLLALPPCSTLVFAPGAALPRDLVFAALPWLFLSVADFDVSLRGTGLVVFAALGALANLHPLTGLHFAILLLLVRLVMEPTVDGLVAVTLRGLAFVVGAAPYVVQYLTRPAALGAVDPAIYAWRLGDMAGESVGAWCARMEPTIWLAAAALTAAVAARRRGAAPPRALVVGLAVSFVLGALGPTLGRFVPPLRAVQLGRFERIADWHAVVLFAVCVVSAWRARAFVAAAAASGCFAASLIQSGAFGDDAAPRGPIARLGRAVDRRAGVPFESPAPAGLTSRKDVPDPTSPSARDDFLAVCRFAREKTSADALFLVPPEHWAPFRVYARRGVAVTRKEGGAALSFLGAAGMDWFHDYAQAGGAYASGDAAAWTALVDKWNAAYVVLDGRAATPSAWTEAFAAGKFRVLDARRK